MITAEQAAAKFLADLYSMAHTCTREATGDFVFESLSLIGRDVDYDFANKVAETVDVTKICSSIRRSILVCVSHYADRIPAFDGLFTRVRAQLVTEKGESYAARALDHIPKMAREPQTAVELLNKIIGWTK